MAWEIIWDGNSVDYTFNDESFSIDEIVFVSNEVHEEEGGYKEPNDCVMTDKYSAETQHGSFEWEVTGRTTGFNTQPDIENVEIIKAPAGCESDLPGFEIEIIDESL